ncbi:MAG: carboxypeptidase-like regulatory domain-containing protein [Candidatus Eisenbacteria bacterium]|uniref:Carboxypeptidase regulatory-like domain-containing protein n=1 Tax=Eiseniibacteriota bacterium TaxID=2212470 RepID=A0A956M180_UNCEI|nr:hypothetical protein [Candidatus Eisenbacteria bacterium]
MTPLRLTWISTLILCSFSCGSNPVASRSDSVLEVRVYWEDQGLPDRSVEVRELGRSAVTGEDGIARFSLPAGAYTVRALVNARGPAGYEDYPVTISRGDLFRLDIVDCLPCR